MAGQAQNEEITRAQRIHYERVSSIHYERVTLNLVIVRGTFGTPDLHHYFDDTGELLFSREFDECPF